MRLGILLALASAVLFGASTPFAKNLLGSVDPWLMAGLLYIGAGLASQSSTYRVAPCGCRPSKHP
jgi:drug/metabolite transporter (DMT)-like permease